MLRRTLIRRSVLSVAISGAMLAPMAVEASAAPVTAPIVVNHPFQVPITIFIGDPMPFTTQPVSAGGLGGGRVEFSTQPGASMPYSVGVQVRWVNLNTGASGAADIPIGYTASASTIATTGSGQIAAAVFATGEPNTVVPGLGTFNAQ